MPPGATARAVHAGLLDVSILVVVDHAPRAEGRETGGPPGAEVSILVVVDHAPRGGEAHEGPGDNPGFQSLL